LSVRLIKKLAALTKKRFVSLHSGVFFLLTAWVFESECNERFFVRDEIPFFWKQPVLALAKHQVATDLGRLEACLRTDTKMETQDRKSHEADAGCAFLVTINIKDHMGKIVNDLGLHAWDESPSFLSFRD